MKKMFMGGLAAIAGLMMAGAAMAHSVDVLMMELQPDTAVYELTLVPDGAGLMAGAEVLAELDFVQDSLSVAEIAVFQTVSLTNHLATRGAAADSMVDDAMHLWRVRTIEAFTVSPDLLI